MGFKVLETKRKHYVTLQEYKIKPPGPFTVKIIVELNGAPMSSPPVETRRLGLNIILVKLGIYQVQI